MVSPELYWLEAMNRKKSRLTYGELAQPRVKSFGLLGFRGEKRGGGAGVERF